MPKTRFTLRHVSVENIFALTASNVVHAEWDAALVLPPSTTKAVTPVTWYRLPS